LPLSAETGRSLLYWQSQAGMAPLRSTELWNGHALAHARMLVWVKRSAIPLVRGV
jgi:hypothetical protein